MCKLACSEVWTLSAFSLLSKSPTSQICKEVAMNMERQVEHSHLPVRGLSLHVAQAGKGSHLLSCSPAGSSFLCWRPVRMHSRLKHSNTSPVAVSFLLQASWARWCSCTDSRRYGTRGATRCWPWPPPGTAPSRRTGEGTGSRTSRRSRRPRRTTTWWRISSQSSMPSPFPR